MTERGKFITVEGVDGAGKSTQFEVIANALKEKGIDFVRTREPGGTESAEKIREAVVIFTPARPVDGKLMKWNTSTNATRMSTKEVTTFRLPDAVRAVDRIRIANCHASYLTTNKAEEKS